MRYTVALIAFCFSLLSAPVYGEETVETIQETSSEASLHYPKYAEMPEIKELPSEDDDLYSGAEVVSAIRLSDEEKQEALSSDFDYIEKEYEHPELSCDNPQLAKQTALFIRKQFTANEGSVTGRRDQLLLVKNMHNFTEITEDDLGVNNFKAKAALANLRINENRKIYKICESRDNKFGKYNNIYLIIYPYLKYYKVVVTNLIGLPEKMEEATFIYSW